MKPLTEKQQQFAIHKAAGLGTRESAVAAGYASNNADVQGAILLRDPRIKRAIAAAKRVPNPAKALASRPKDDEVDAKDAKHRMPKARYTDAKEFLLDAMNHKHLPIAVRGDYAKALLPYQHARIGEKGKKENAKDRAREVAGDGAKRQSKPKFGTKQPPQLKVVGGKG